MHLSDFTGFSVLIWGGDSGMCITVGVVDTCLINVGMSSWPSRDVTILYKFQLVFGLLCISGIFNYDSLGVVPNVFLYEIYCSSVDITFDSLLIGCFCLLLCCAVEWLKLVSK